MALTDREQMLAWQQDTRAERRLTDVCEQQDAAAQGMALFCVSFLAALSAPEMQSMFALTREEQLFLLQAALRGR